MATRTLVAVPLVTARPPLAEQVRAAQASGADLVELRVDLIDDVAAVEELLRQPCELPLIMTVRAADEGGAWVGDEAERIALLERLGLHKPGYVDVELATWQRSANLRQKIGLVGAGASGDEVSGTTTRRSRNQLILSHHDLHGSPTDLGAIFDALVEAPGAIGKAVFTPRDATEALRVLAALARRADHRRLIALALGEAGVCTRVLAGKFGAYLTFAALAAGAESAPGQLTLAELRGVYRFERIGPRTGVYGVVGWPVTHSLGPELHNAALAAAGADGVYVRLPVGPTADDFGRFMTLATTERALDIRGLSITLPHKEHALRWLDAHGGIVTDLARRCGAVNTFVWQADGRWIGDNTDAQGLLAALATAGARPVAGQTAGVLGAGGVARAAVVTLQQLGVAVTVYGRTVKRAADLARELRCAWEPWEARVRYAGDYIINCTPVGMWPAVADTPLPPETLRRGLVVCDTIYRPARTRLLREAAERGCGVTSGVEMFIGQAAAQHALWHGRAPDVGVLREVLRSAGAFA